MKNGVILIFLANFVVYSSVHSIHNFLKKLYEELPGTTHSKTSLLDILTITRFAPAYIISNIADRTQCHCIIALLCFAGYIATISAVYFFPSEIGLSGFGLRVIAIDALMKAFDSGLFPIMETLVINASSFKGSTQRTYSYMRFSSVAGRLVAHMSNILANSLFGFEKEIKNRNMIGVSLIYFLLGIPVFVSAHFKKAGTTKKEVPAEKRKNESFLKSLRKIMTLEYTLLLIFVGCQGVHRIAIASYQSVLLGGIFKNDNKERWIFCSRSISEFLFELSTPYFEKSIGNIWMVFIGALAGIVKVLSCAFYPKGISNNEQFGYFLFFESFKALFSSFMGYGCTRLIKYYNSPSVQTSAQGLYNGMYNAVSASISGFTGYLTIREEKDGETLLKTFFLSSAVFGIVGMVPVMYLLFVRNKQRAMSV